MARKFERKSSDSIDPAAEFDGGCPFISASVVGSLKKLVGSLKLRRVAVEFSQTKSGGRCSFHFTSSEVFHPMPHRPQEPFDYGAFGGLQYRFKLLELSKRTICSAEISGIMLTFSRTKSGGRCWRHFTSWRA